MKKKTIKIEGSQWLCKFTRESISIIYNIGDNVVLFRIISKNIDILEISINKILKNILVKKILNWPPFVICCLFSSFYIEDWKEQIQYKWKNSKKEGIGRWFRQKLTHQSREKRMGKEKI